jgi:hypothetical protein
MAPRGYPARSSRPCALRLGPENRVRWTAVRTPERRKTIQWLKCLGHSRRSEAEAKELSQDGSTKKKNFKDAPAHAEGSKSLACCPVGHVPAMRKPCTGPCCVPFLWLLPRPPSVDRRGRLSHGFGTNFLLIELPSCANQASCEECRTKCRSDAV